VRVAVNSLFSDSVRPSWISIPWSVDPR
jgi:hypothetical protein